ncbi:unnamed protein product [Heterobilharzia americana]|nr:unnamed protein product [Heterobilharzia americana]
MNSNFNKSDFVHYKRIQNSLNTTNLNWGGFNDSEGSSEDLKDRDPEMNSFTDSDFEIETSNSTVDNVSTSKDTSNDFSIPVNISLTSLPKSGNNTNFDYRMDFKFIKYFVGETIGMRCIIPEGPYVVMWNKIGMEYPLTIGKRRFVPDPRIIVKYKPPNKWRLRIADAKLTDSGLYTCTVKSVHEEEKRFKGSDDIDISWKKVNDNQDKMNNNTDSKFYNPDYYISVVEVEPMKGKQLNRSPVAAKFISKNRTLTVTGPNVAYFGRPLELKCYAKFPSAFQFPEYEVVLEWYHRGIQKKSDPYKPDSVYIEQRWLNANTLESRLFIKRASESDTGQWICLEKYKPIKKTEHSSSQVVRSSPMQKNSFAGDRLYSDRSSKSIISKDIIPSTASFISTASKVTFGQIEVEIIDISKASVHLESPNLDNGRHVYSYIHRNSELIRSKATNYANSFKISFFLAYISLPMKTLSCIFITTVLSDVIM